MSPITDPCPACDAAALRIEYRFRVTQAGLALRFSLAGAQPKLPVERWPWLVCDACGVEAEGKES